MAADNWLEASVASVLQSHLKHVRDYDEASITMEELVARTKLDIEVTITRAYDHGFEHGLTAQVDEDEEDDEMQLDLDLDTLRKIGEEGEEIDEEE